MSGRVRRSRSRSPAAAAAAADAGRRVLDVALVFPHQLFDPASHPAIHGALQKASSQPPPSSGSGNRAEKPAAPRARVLLVEESLLFTQFKFHKAKLVFHRASMTAFAAETAAYLATQQQQPRSTTAAVVGYVPAVHPLHDIRALVRALGGATDAATSAKPTRQQVAELLRLDMSDDADASAAGLGEARLHVCDVVDDWLRRRLTKACEQHQVELLWYPTPNFVTPPDEFRKYFDDKKQSGSKRPFFFANFYAWQRERLGVLMTKDGGPVGGKWSFDAENRKKVPKGTSIPIISGGFDPHPTNKSKAANTGKSAAAAIDLDDDDAPPKKANGSTWHEVFALIDHTNAAEEHVAAAVAYVEAHFKECYGTCAPWIESLPADVRSRWRSSGPGDSPGPGKKAPPLPLPITRSGATALLSDFISRRFAKFGEYEDAMVAGQPFLWHSLLSPSINAGLLNPMDAVNAAVEAHHDKKRSPQVSLASAEGFVRQVIGWREFVRATYELEGRKQRTLNSYGFTRKMPEAFWTGESGLQPVDVVTRRVLQLGYCHHIERLMVLGCFFLLCEIRPDDVYEWFSTLFLDAFDWVMVPNVYGMSQGSDGGDMMTKPYVCGSNYLLKMGDWDAKQVLAATTGKRGGGTGTCIVPAGAADDRGRAAPLPEGRTALPTWAAVWDGLFWRFLDRHRDRVRANPRLGMLVTTFDKMDAAKRRVLIADAEWYLARLDHASKH